MKSTKRTELAICALLCLVTAVAYYRVLEADFVHYDDQIYVTRNPHIQTGLTARGIAWAFTTNTAANWHPLTWLSHLTDSQLFGENPAGHHATAWLLHTVNACLLFLVLYRLTQSAPTKAARPNPQRAEPKRKRGRKTPTPPTPAPMDDPWAIWKSAWVAAMFAIHPLHVESVAWVSERKDVLSTLFWLLTMWTYVAYVRQRPSPARYVIVMLLLALGLMAKPMLVTLPLVLLLLDLWPLERVARGDARDRARRGSRWQAWGPLIIEKLPLLAIVVTSSVITFLVQRSGGAVQGVGNIALSDRLANAVVSYVVYLRKAIWPVDLAAFYPHPVFTGGVGAPQLIGSLLLLFLITAAVIYEGRRFRYLPVGWFWYLGTLIPVIGIVQVGNQGLADRYTYVPLIGIFIMVAWGVGDLVHAMPKLRVAAAAAALGSVVVATALTWQQVGYWQSDEMLARRMLDVTNQNFFGHYLLGTGHLHAGDREGAMAEYRRSLDVLPTYVRSRHDLAGLLIESEQWDEAARQLATLVKLQPDSAEHRLRLAVSLANVGQTESALPHLARAAELAPGDAEIRLKTGDVLVLLGRFDEAIAQFEQALALGADPVEVYRRIAAARTSQNRPQAAEAALREALAVDPDNPVTHTELGRMLLGQKRGREALTHFRQALRLWPDSPEFANNVAWILATNPDPQIRDGHEAVRLAYQASEAQQHRSPGVLDTLAAAYAEQGEFSKALQTIEQALRLTDSADADLAATLRARLQLYKARQPLRDP